MTLSSLGLTCWRGRRCAFAVSTSPELTGGSSLLPWPRTRSGHSPWQVLMLQGVICVWIFTQTPCVASSPNSSWQRHAGPASPDTPTAPVAPPATPATPVAPATVTIFSLPHNATPTASTAASGPPTARAQRYSRVSQNARLDNPPPTSIDGRSTKRK
jgi:hypothetical protein